MSGASHLGQRRFRRRGGHRRKPLLLQQQTERRRYRIIVVDNQDHPLLVLERLRLAPLGVASQPG